MKEKILNYLARLLPFTCIRFLLPRKFILYGHIISDKDHFIRYTYHYPSFSEFDELAAVLRKVGYEFVDLNAYLQDDNKKKILLTIDDGFRIVKDEMHEKLKGRRIPYVLFINTLPLLKPDFIITSLLNKVNVNQLSQPFERLFLSRKEILDLKNEGVHIGFHTNSHQLIKEDFPLINSTEVNINEEDWELFSIPLVFSYPYYAPENYRVVNQFIQQEINVNYFFDTKGFKRNDGIHYFRVCIDSSLSLKEANNSIHMIKRQILQSLYRGNKGSGSILRENIKENFSTTSAAF